MKTSTLLCLASSALLAGCGTAYYNALTFDGDRDRTSVDGDYKVYLVTAGPKTPAPSETVKSNQIKDEIFENTQKIKCLNLTSAVKKNTNGEPEIKLAPAVAIIAPFIISAAIDVGTDIIQGKIDKLESESKKTSVLNINTGYFNFTPNGENQTCLFIIRTDRNKDNPKTLFEFDAYIKNLGETMYVWQPAEAKMSHAAALSELGKPVRIDIAISTQSIVLKKEERALVAAAPATFSFEMIPSGDSAKPMVNTKLPTAVGSPILQSDSAKPLAASLSISITETGSGSTLFKKALDSAEDNLKALRTFGVDYTKNLAEKGRF